MNKGFTTERSVAFHETDMAGIVHFSNFFLWMEITEHAFLKSLGEHPLVKTEGVITGWPRVDARCTYKAPLRFGDRVCIELRVTAVKKHAMEYSFNFYKIRGDEKTAVAHGQMTTVFAAIDEETGRLEVKEIPLPEDLV